MFQGRKLFRSLLVVTTIAVYATMAQLAAAKGGGHGGGGHGGGGHHGGGGGHAGHHGGEHNHHPYQPSHHHQEHHASHHDHHHGDHHDHHYAHHHTDWHHGGWGPGFWGGAALGYGLGYANWDGGGYGGDTYVDNSTSITPVDNSDAYAANQQPGTTNGDRFPTDAWPELGIVTYAGEYGNTQGQVIMRVIPGSAAERAGLVPGDVILTFNGQPVPSAGDLESALGNAGGKFEALVWDARTGRQSTLGGTLDTAAPQPSETAAVQP
jgi:hypothetical protein